jgi:hypothetical protein
MLAVGGSMSDRRGFLGKLLTFCGVAAVAPSVSMAGSPKRDELPVVEHLAGAPAISDRFIYKGFTVGWTGWKQDLSNNFEAGQWYAYNGKKYGKSTKHFYASYPGGERQYWPGQIFDLSWQKWQLEYGIPGPWSTDEEKFRYRLMCLQHLMKLIDGNV